MLLSVRALKRFKRSFSLLRLLRGIRAQRQSISFRHPAAAHRLIQVDDGYEGRGIRLHSAQFGREELLLSVEHGEVGGVAAVVLEACQPCVFLVGGNLSLLRRELFLHLSAADEGVLRVGEGVLYRLLVGIEGGLLLRFGLSELSQYSASREYGTRDGTDVIPGGAGTDEQARKVFARPAGVASEGYPGEELCLRGPDLRVGRYEVLFRLQDIGTPFQKV